VGRLSFGLSPPGLLLLYLDWLVHLAFSPGKQLDLMRKVLRKALRFGLYAARSVLKPDTPPAWQDWLRRHSRGHGAAPPAGAPERDYSPLGDAPRNYVLEE
jgi:hypothetical protein